MGFGHINKLAKVICGDGARYISTESRPINRQEARRQLIQRCLQALTHAPQCRHAECDLPSCKKMKIALSHVKRCQQMKNGGCAICKQLLALCCYHSRSCSDERCVVPYCFQIKRKLGELNMQQRAQQLMRIQPDQGKCQTNKIAKAVFCEGDHPVSPQETRRKTGQECEQYLTHASQCRLAECDLASCKKMKRVLSHAKRCQKKKNGGCAICKQLLALCCYHSRRCSVQRCVLPYCFQIKRKLQELNATQNPTVDEDTTRPGKMMRHMQQD